VLELRLKLGAQAVGEKLVGLLCGQAVDGRVDIGSAHAGEHDTFHVGQVDVVVVQKLAKSAIERGDGVGGLDPQGRDDLALADAHNLGGRDAHVDAYCYLHVECDIEIYTVVM